MIEPNVYDRTMRRLLSTLPPSGRGSDDYVDLAIEQMAALAPANAAEAGIAAQYIACTAQAGECLRMAQAAVTDLHVVRSLTAQGASMMRLARDVRAQLMRVQALRRKREADPAARAQDAYVRESVERGLRQALAEVEASDKRRDTPAPPSPGCAPTGRS